MQAVRPPLTGGPAKGSLKKRKKPTKPEMPSSSPKSSMPLIMKLRALSLPPANGRDDAKLVPSPGSRMMVLKDSRSAFL